MTVTAIWNHREGTWNGIHHCEAIQTRAKEKEPPISRDDYFSQFGQDVVVASMMQYVPDYEVFSSDPNKRGVFVDCATNHQTFGSNTYLIEHCLNWTGLCIEPNHNYFPGILTKRSCTLVPNCVSDQVRKVLFELLGPIGSIIEDNDPENKKRQESKTSTVTCLPLSHIFTKNNITRVHYFSLDVEGHEFFALKGINWNETTIDIITIENASPAIISYLGERGIVPFLCLTIDTLFIREELVPHMEIWWEEKGQYFDECILKDHTQCLMREKQPPLAWTQCGPQHKNKAPIDKPPPLLPSISLSSNHTRPAAFLGSSRFGKTK